MFKKHLSVLFVLILLLSCSSKTILDYNSRQKVKTIALLEITHPPGWVFGVEISDVADIILGLGTGGGYLKAIVDHTIDNTNESDAMAAVFEAILKKNDFSISKSLQTNLKKDLERLGYRVEIVKVNREIQEFYSNYETINSQKFDAILDIYIRTYGYTKDNWGKPYSPQVDAHIKLVNAQSGKLMHQDRITYGINNILMDGILAPKQHQYTEAKDIFKEGGKKIVEGFQTASKETARTIAKSFAK